MLRARVQEVQSYVLLLSVVAAHMLLAIDFELWSSPAGDGAMLQLPALHYRMLLFAYVYWLICTFSCRSYFIFALHATWTKFRIPLWLFDSLPPRTRLQLWQTDMERLSMDAQLRRYLVNILERSFAYPQRLKDVTQFFQHFDIDAEAMKAEELVERRAEHERFAQSTRVRLFGDDA